MDEGQAHKINVGRTVKPGRLEERGLRRSGSTYNIGTRQSFPHDRAVQKETKSDGF